MSSCSSTVVELLLQALQGKDHHVYELLFAETIRGSGVTHFGRAQKSQAHIQQQTYRQYTNKPLLYFTFQCWNIQNSNSMFVCVQFNVKLFKDPVKAYNNHGRV